MLFGEIYLGVIVSLFIYILEDDYKDEIMTDIPIYCRQSMVWYYDDYSALLDVILICVNKDFFHE